MRSDDSIQKLILINTRCISHRQEVQKTMFITYYIESFCNN